MSTLLRRCVQTASALLLCAASAQAQSFDVRFSPYEDCEARAMALLDQAQHTVDVAQYNIRNERFFAKLSELRARGVRVRIVVDAKNAAKPWNTLDDDFEAAGFDIQRYENTRHRYAIMHHKFTIVDDARVMTGSYNWNETAQMVNDENMLVLDDPGLVAAYRDEFAELRGAPERRGVGHGQRARVLFSPEDRPRNAVLDAIHGAQQQILVAMFTFTDRTVARALRDAAQRGVEVVLLVERKQAVRSNADETVASGGARVIVGANTSAPHSAMHQKFAVVDGATVITGACNWTYTAFTSSNEDLLLVDDAALAREYTDAFASLVSRYDPAGYDPADFGVAGPEADTHFVLHMPRTRLGETVWIVGDHPALGSWDPTRAVPLRTTASLFPSWAGRVRLPAGARVKWKAIVRPAGNVSGGERWELDGDRQLDVDPAGTDGFVSTDFRDLVELGLSVRYPALPAGSELRVVGADPALGSWDPALGWPMQADPADPTRYTARIPFPARTWVAFKLVVVPSSGAARWESGWDRSVYSGDRVVKSADLGGFQN